MLFVLALCRSGEKRGRGLGGGGGEAGGGGWCWTVRNSRGQTPSTRTSLRRSAPLHATRRHGGAHLLVLYHSALLKENYCS